MMRNVASFLPAKSSGLMTKSSGIHPEANERPTRPPERLSTTDHSSAIRIAECSGATTLPDRICKCFVIIARAAPVTEGFGYNPPNAWKCRSGVQMAVKPFSSPNFAPSINSRYFSEGFSP